MTVPAITASSPTGPDGAPLLVLGNSLGTSTLLWSHVVPLLTSHFRVITWDLPGHGLSPTATERFAVTDIAHAVVEAIPEPFFYAGVSLGGAVGLELLAGGHTRAAAIICSGAVVGTPQGWEERAAQVRTMGTSSLVTASAGRWFAPGSIAREPKLTGQLLHALAETDDESYALCCEALAVFDARPQLPRMEAPVLAVWGEHDAVTPRERAEEVAAGVPHGSLVRIPDASHLPPADNPEALARALTDFFSTL